MPMLEIISPVSNTGQQTFTVSWPPPGSGSFSRTSSWDVSVVGMSANLEVLPQNVEQVFSPPLPDKSSFSKIKKSGQVKMTDYQRGYIKTQNFSIVVPRTKYTFVYIGETTWDGPSGSMHVYSSDYLRTIMSTNYEIKGDMNAIKHAYPSASLIADDFEKRISDAINEVMSEVVGDINSQYDLLTELAELRTTLGSLKSYLNVVRNPLRAFKTLADKLKKSKLPEKDIHDGIATAWMRYRYEIMPIYYSIKDLSELMKEQYASYRTKRSKRVIEGFPLDESGDSSYFGEEVTGTVIVRAVGKEKTSLDPTARLIDLIKFNPFSTAWELIPYSFVVDWFINVGDVIDAFTSDLFHFSNERKFCYSVKRQYIRTTFFVQRDDERLDIPSDQLVSWADGVSKGPILPPLSKGSKRSNLYVLSTETAYSYVRKTFTPQDINLQFKFDMNWKRWIDAYVLSLGSARNQLKKLRT